MTKRFLLRFVQGAILLCAPVLGTSGRAQGTMTFAGWAGWAGTSYQELGLRFQVVVPPGTSGYDSMGITVGGGNTPGDGTAFMLWFRQDNPSNYVSLSPTSGALFGLSSVWLADPTAPSPSPVSISFVGYLPGGGAVTNTFTTPGNGANTFATYTFNSNFASGLTRVDILAPKWAMDNLVWVPEPSGVALVLIGTGVFICGRMRGRAVNR